MGVGTPIDLLEAVHRGVDMFDCVFPTRTRSTAACSRAAGAEYNVRVAANVRDFGPLDPTATAVYAPPTSKAYLAHLFRSGETLAQRLLSYHNVAGPHRPDAVGPHGDRGRPLGRVSRRARRRRGMSGRCWRRRRFSNRTRYDDFPGQLADATSRSRRSWGYRVKL